MNPIIWLVLFVLVSCESPEVIITDIRFCGHPVVLDSEAKIIPWHNPKQKAYDHFLDLRWNFIKNHVPFSPGPDPRSRYPQYYFYCAFRNQNGNLEPDLWMNDIGEKIPNWFENARLYYAYTGDISVMNLIGEFVDYVLIHGTSPSTFAWPCFPYTTANAGDTVFRGFTNAGRLYYAYTGDISVMNLIGEFVDYVLIHGTSPSTFAWPSFPYTTANAGDTVFRGFTSAGRFAQHEIQVDHAGEMGLTYYRMYLFSGDEKYLTASLDVANVLASNISEGNPEKSVLPYRVTMDDGLVTAPYGANWTGCYLLFEHLINDSAGEVSKYTEARDKIQRFLLQYPMKTGYWTDGHSDTDVKTNTYKSNLSASNMTLCLFDYPDLDPEWKSDIPKLIKWTEDHFVFRTAAGEPSTMWGANIVGEQDSFNYKMDYQTARYAAACARWYKASGDESYKEKAYRSLNWVTYCNDSIGMAFESPVSKGILSWWSDSYGECPRMFYHVFAAIPEWAPPGEDHILYSEGILKNVSYSKNRVKFKATTPGTEYLRLSFKPSSVKINGKLISKNSDSEPEYYQIESLGKGDYAVSISHNNSCEVIVSK